MCIQRAELAFALTEAQREDAYLRDDYDSPAIRWRVLDGDAIIAPGVDAVSTPGHTPGHMSYRVRAANGNIWLFAMDAIDLQAGIDLDRLVGTWPANRTSRWCARRTTDSSPSRVTKTRIWLRAIAR